ncbi:fucose permease [Psychromicrobium silvestre]|uniref:Fucose permease n=1 Tax=Psychromicrobium silvestre TaxID=1645614 RepID=A0A7Y9S7A4_9MICC|nr:MFS transporter [Psychromicrobium silvestre]NYE95959.1 fucose permease [Psychromicrobium silvestre]
MSEKQARPDLALIATMVIFAVNGLAFASWAARIPTVARVLNLSNGEMGALLLTMALGSVIALPLAGSVASRIGTANTVRLGASISAVGGLTLALALTLGSVPITVAGLFLFGAGIGLWDVSQNVEGAAIERKVGRSVMARFHAAFSGGAFLGALGGAGLSKLEVAMPVHLLILVAVVLLAIFIGTRYFLPDSAHQSTDSESSTTSRTAWLEPRTLLIGLVVLGAALTEGAANDWMAKATVDGLNQSEPVGALMFAIFIAAMTIFRFFGGRVIDHWGRVPVLYASLGAALIGLLIFVFAPNVGIAAVGAVLWGAGAALGFPTGMSAAADDPVRAAKRVSVVSTIGYVAFLAGPPAIGFLGEHFTLRPALLVIGVVMLLSILVVPAARPPKKLEETVSLQQGQPTD